MSNPNALYLLADHIKLSLLERQRSKALNLLQADADDAAATGDSSAGASERDAQDGHIARSLDQLEEGIASLKTEQARLESQGEEGKALNIGDALPGLQKKLTELTAQFNGTAPVSAAGTSSSIKPKRGGGASSGNTNKAVRFKDKPLPPPGTDGDDVDLEAQRNSLFNRPYTDDPDVDGSLGGGSPSLEGRYDDQDNVQLHQMHSSIIADQDAQLDALGVSIGRQRELSMMIGDELDSHVAMLEEGERLTDQHQTRIDRARRQVGKIARSAGDCKQMVAIVVLIIILILLIAILK
ncbi:syntaxin 8 [Sporothrix brasiliensis 5110]|uniref:Syntaxin 8 n=1 Tax=Sporothrix brasiliensis 5110 TaxID=1398154 RepID=A0A0C2EJW1_9PEZI|nr:syntaxin 8 [Sporothrix brasiliensis 5110]KIH86334.1 syntaxin 8 [Sporothrix brasiliensis 5110]